MSESILTIAYKGLFSACREISFENYDDAREFMMGEFDSCDAMSAMITQLKNYKETKFTINPKGEVIEHD